MSEMVITPEATDTTEVGEAQFEQVLQSARRLSTRQKARLAEKLIHEVSEAIEPSKEKLRDPRGILDGVSISAEDIDEARREMWGKFPREDIA